MKQFLITACSLALAIEVSAAGIVFNDAPHEDPWVRAKIASAYCLSEKGRPYWEAIVEIHSALERLNHAQFREIFGPPLGREDKYVLPICEDVSYMLSGLGAPKYKREFYRVSMDGGVEITFIESQQMIYKVTLMLSYDEAFVPLDEFLDADSRAAWEKPKIEAIQKVLKDIGLIAYNKGRSEPRFVCEIPPQASKPQMAALKGPTSNPSPDSNDRQTRSTSHAMTCTLRAATVSPKSSSAQALFPPSCLSFA